MISGKEIKWGIISYLAEQENGAMIKELHRFLIDKGWTSTDHRAIYPHLKRLEAKKLIRSDYRSFRRRYFLPKQWREITYFLKLKEFFGFEFFKKHYDSFEKHYGSQPFFFVFSLSVVGKYKKKDPIYCCDIALRLFETLNEIATEIRFMNKLREAVGVTSRKMTEDKKNSILRLVITSKCLDDYLSRLNDFSNKKRLEKGRRTLVDFVLNHIMKGLETLSIALLGSDDIQKLLGGHLRDNLDVRTFSLCRIWVAVAKKDVSICDKKIPNQRYKDWCYSEVATAKRDPRICEKIQDQNEKERCYWGVATAKRDPRICEKIQDQSSRHICYIRVAEAKEDPSICNRIQDQQVKNLCYEYVVKDKKDHSICKKIQNQLLKDWCYSEVAKTKKDPSICDKIQDQLLKVKCYLWVAKVKEDVSICDKLQNQQLKDSCYEWVAKSKKPSNV